MNIGMQETQSGVAPIDDTDAATFGRFMEFLHTGDYNAAPPAEASSRIFARTFPALETVNENGQDLQAVPEPREERYERDAWALDVSIPPRVNDFEEMTWNSPSTSRKLKKHKSKTTAEDSFDNKAPVILASPTSKVDIVRPIHTQSNFSSADHSDWSQDYLPVFLSHAQLYVFADKYEIPDLGRLAARRLDEALGSFQFTSLCATDFAHLMQYIYDNTAEREDEADVLRSIVGIFIANNVKSLIDTESFVAIIENGKSLARDIVQKIVARL